MSFDVFPSASNCTISRSRQACQRRSRRLAGCSTLMVQNLFYHRPRDRRTEIFISALNHLHRPQYLLARRLLQHITARPCLQHRRDEPPIGMRR